MKGKLLNVLAVALVTFAILSPGLVIFGIVWWKHLELVKTQNFSCEMITNNLDDLSSGKITHQGFPQYNINTIFQWFVLGTPICIGLGIIAYDRYLVYRAAVLKRQVQMLERLWQQSIEQ